MEAPAEGACIRAALPFYEQLQNSDPGSERAEIAEHAILMAVRRAARVSEPGFHYDVWRNARHSYRRTQRRQREAQVEVRAARTVGAGLAASGGQRMPTPEQIVVANDLRAHLFAAAGGIHPAGTRVLQGLLERETEAETAEALGVSPRTVRRIRGSIRAAAATLAGVEEA